MLLVKWASLDSICPALQSRSAVPMWRTISRASSRTDFLRRSRRESVLRMVGILESLCSQLRISSGVPTPGQHFKVGLVHEERYKRLAKLSLCTAFDRVLL